MFSIFDIIILESELIKMNIYILRDNDNNGKIIGVFTTKEKAELAENDYQELNLYNDIEVIEFEADTVKESKVETRVVTICKNY